MPQLSTVDTFVARVESGDFLEAIETFYTEDACMHENGAPPRAGLAALLENERRVLAAFPDTRARHLGPLLVDGDHVAIRWQFDLVPVDGPVRRFEEIAWQRWEGERIAEEHFFYDPAPLAR